MDWGKLIQRPVIGVTGPDRGGDVAWWFCALALFRAGARPLRITPQNPTSIDEVQGLVIGGGADVSPELYGQEKIELAGEVVRKKHTFSHSLLRILLYPLIYFSRRLFSLKTMVFGDMDRDALETLLIGEALEKQKPILGICRGAQLMNVYLGGSLYQELSEFYSETPQFHTVFPKKTVILKSNTLLARLFKNRSIKVNALHRQAIDKLGDGLRVSATENNGVVQAIEHSDLDFALGVQWHPEYLPQHKEQQLIFRSLVDACK